MPAPLTLVVANKNYSSWSLRPWVAMTELGIPFSERLLKFDSEDWRRNIDILSPTGLVPVLWEGKPGDGFATYGVVLDGAAHAYRQTLPNSRGMVAWTESALAETEFVAMDEPYA